MPRKKEPGQYEVGRVAPQGIDGPRPRRTGTYGVIKGENIEQKGHLEWSHICEGIIKTSRWCAYRIGDGDNGKGVRTDLLESFDSKKDAVKWVQRRHGDRFTTEY